MSTAALDALREGGKRAIARCLADMESGAERAEVAQLLDAAQAGAQTGAQAHVIGLTGPPGVGKSSLVNELIARWRRDGRTVAVVAIDPSSAISGGALLGDRTRITTDPTDRGVFIRSLASRGALGGLTDLAFPSMVLLRALFDIVLVETVGVGQSEADIADLADTVILCVQPASGDSLQFMKAGIMEIPDIAVVTKADLGAAAERAVGEMRGALTLTARGMADGDGTRAAILAVSAQTGAGLDELCATIDGHWEATATTRSTRRRRQARDWLRQSLRAAFGERGLTALTPHLSDATEAPFQLRQRLARRCTWEMADDA